MGNLQLRATVNMPRAQRWFAVVLFATAMAWVEAAVVLYLRTLGGRIDPYQIKPIPDELRGLERPEMLREAATMVMLVCAGWLAGRSWRARFGYLLIAFGVWDIVYYLFLKILTGWPRTLLDWDILFLIPLPWWGPVMTPVSVAALMVLFGTLSVQQQPALWPTPRSVWIATAGVLLLLWAFMFHAVGLLFRGADLTQVRESLPESFPWLLFVVGLLLTAVPIIDLSLQLMARNRFNQPKGRREQNE